MGIKLEKMDLTKAYDNKIDVSQRGDLEKKKKGVREQENKRVMPRTRIELVSLPEPLVN